MFNPFGACPIPCVVALARIFLFPIHLSSYVPYTIITLYDYQSSALSDIPALNEYLY